MTLLSLQHKNFRLLIYTALMTLFIHSASSQSAPYVLPDTMDHSERASAKARFEARQNTYMTYIKASYKGKVRSKLLSGVKHFKEDFVESFTNGRYVYGHPFNASIDDLFQRILNGNPEIGKDYEILVSRDVQLNAFCLYDGTIVMNMGTFHYLKSEAHLAGILSHEIAHKILRHSEQSQKERIEHDLQSKSDPSIQRLKRQRFGRQKLALDLLREQVYATSKQRRAHEHQADSLGFILYKNAGFPAEKYGELFDQFHHSDSFKVRGVSEETIANIFHTDTHPFNPAWVDISDIDFTAYDHYHEALDRDSISTHPSGEERYDYLNKHFTLDTQATPYSDSQSDFDKLRSTAQYGMVPSLMFDEDYGLAAFICLLHIQEGFELDQHKAWLGDALTKMVEARETYTLNRHVRQINPKSQHTDYIRFLHLIWELSLQELKDFASHYDINN